MTGRVVSGPLLALAMQISGGPAMAFPDRAPLAHSGGFGDRDCTECHFDGTAIGQSPDLALSGLPACYAPGATYGLGVRLRAAAARGGYQLAVRFARGADAGSTAGRLLVTDSRGLIRTDKKGRQFAGSTLAGSTAAGEGFSWKLSWTAPGVVRAVDFDLAANAANGDDSPFGDRVHLRHITVCRNANLTTSP